MKISYGQLWAVLFLFRIFSFMSSGTEYSLKQMAGVLISAAVQLLILVPVLIIYRNKSKRERLSEKKNYLFSFCFILTGAVVFKRTLEVIYGSGNGSFTEETAVLVCIVLAVIFCSGSGVNAAARAAVIVLGLFLFLSLVLLITSYKEVHFSNLYSVSSDSSIIQYAVKDFADSIVIVVAFILPVLTDEYPVKGIITYYISEVIFAEIFSFTGAMILGRVAYISYFPFFRICSFSAPFSVQRSDAMFIFIYTLICVVLLTICVSAAVKFSGKDFKSSTGALMIVMITAGGFAISSVKFHDNISSGLEVRDRAFVQGMGIDYDGEHYNISLRLFDSEEVYSGIGRTLQAAVDDAEKSQKKDFFTGHTEIVAVSSVDGVAVLEKIIDENISPGCLVMFCDNPQNFAYENDTAAVVDAISTAVRNKTGSSESICDAINDYYRLSAKY